MPGLQREEGGTTAGTCRARRPASAWRQKLLAGAGGADSPEPHAHEVEGVRGGADEEELHDGVVEADVGPGEEVDIPREEDGEVQRLRLE